MGLTSEHIPVDALLEAAQRSEVVAAMQDFYEETDRLIAEQAATCWNKGNCCRFGEFEHRLYVTALEVCYYLANGGLPAPPTLDACPHAYDGKCHARDRRHLGCRVFFCDPSAQDWPAPLTEKRLQRLRQLHERVGIPYFYADWMTVLRAFCTDGP